MILLVFLNLLKNSMDALRENPGEDGEPTIWIGSEESLGKTRIRIRDNGPGIAAADLERIFEPFYTTRRDEGGTGLGLALCREYAIQIGADLSVSTAPGRGACFRLRLPGHRRR